MGCQFLGTSHKVGLHGARFVISPLPYDATASYGTGARFAPMRIIEASLQLELFDEELEESPFEAGIHTLPIPEMPVEPNKAKEICFDITKGLIEKGKVPVSIGGDHSVTIGIVEAISSSIQDFTLLQLDAHTDMRTEYQGTGFSHACVARQALNHCCVVQAGIRSSSKKEWDFLKAEGRLPVTASFINKDLTGATKQIIEGIKGPKVYITIDVDCLDPSVMPATGTPEPGGLDWFQLTYILREVANRFEIIGFDVVELAPIPGIHFPDYLCARLIYKMIGYIFFKKG